MEQLKFGMVGGGLDSFIGKVHYMGAQFDGSALLCAGCFSRDPEKNAAAGARYAIDKDRVYSDYAEMAQKEAEREDGIDYAVILTPNSTHYAAAKAFLTNNIHVLCEKPLCFTLEEAKELQRLSEEKGLLFGVNYSYSGTNMVREARRLIRDGFVGRILDVKAEYLQEYLVDDISAGEKNMVQLSSWRKDPAVAGQSNCIGDIGTHIAHTVSFMTGMKITRVAAMLDCFGQPLDLNANLLIEMENGAHGCFSVSQVCIGCRNGFRVRVFGTDGAIEWFQEEPNRLLVTKKGCATQIYERGMGYTTPASRQEVFIPAGHPEGYYEAFGSMYRNWNRSLRNRIAGKPEDMDFPGIEDGMDGLRFISACVKSSREGGVWTAL